nr:hypothetical protein [Planctomycetota bacterium]
MDRLPHAIELVTRDCTGAALAEILQVSRRSADRRLYAVRQLGHCDGWSAADLAHLALWEHRHLGSAHLREAMD